jgi:hypothetical protein
MTFVGLGQGRRRSSPLASCIVYTNGNFALCFLMLDSNSSAMARWRSDDAKALNGFEALV